MLKIKGLKKKKKGKKNKHKEEELFEAAELEQYRREHQLKEAEGETAEKDTNEESEEWQKFKALTSGVDDILKKTQGDLDRIKSTSFFQRKPPGPSSSEKEPEVKEQEKVIPKEKKWINFEEGLSLDAENKETEEDSKEEEVAHVKPIVEVYKVEEEEEEEESEEENENDDIFDTSYVDVVASGEVKLAYIPDSPTEEEETGFDPFDTSIVEKVIKVDPNEKKRNLVSLGSAVEVLTGKVEKASCVSDLKAKRRRPRAQDLLLGSFDEDQGTPVAPTESAPKSILDEDPIFDEETSAVIGLPPVTPNLESSPIFSQPQVTQEKVQVDTDILVSEFIPTFSEPITNDLCKTAEQDDLDDEFAALAAESLSKEGKELKQVKPPRPALPFSDSKRELVLSDGEEACNEDDPFDTTFASKVLPGKFELKLIEKEILENDIPVKNTVSVVQEKINEVLKKSGNEKPKWSENFDEHNFLENDQELLNVKHRDLLGGSTTDLSNIAHTPIKPEAKTSIPDDIIYCDPFDTSGIEVLAAPGKTELKFLEKEFLAQDLEKVTVDLDNDFDPRSEEISSKPSRPDQLVLDKKRISIPKVVAFDVQSPTKELDLLAVGQDEGSKVSKPLTPYYPNVQTIQDEPSLEAELDPFDTSFVTNCPGKVELKLLESEFVNEGKLKHSLSDPDFNPRQEHAPSDEVNIPDSSILIKDESLKADIISEDVIVATKLHTPVVPRKIEEIFSAAEDIDPFDTSIANDLLPGKAEIKILETELIYTTHASLKESGAKISINLQNVTSPEEQTSINSNPISDVLSVSTTDDISEKPLTPLIAASSLDIEDIDPFDTSTIGEIVPGKTELKILESELMSN